MTPRTKAGVWDVVRRWPWLGPLALCLPVLVSYLPAMLWGDLVWDDLTMIRNQAVREVSGLHVPIDGRAGQPRDLLDHPASDQSVVH